MWDSTGKIRMTNIKRTPEEWAAREKQTREHLAGLIAMLDAGRERDEAANVIPVPEPIAEVEIPLEEFPEEMEAEEVEEPIVEEADVETPEEEVEEEPSNTEAAIAEIKALLAKLTGKE